jgi:hypothetical protein
MIFANTLCVFALSNDSAFAVLQARTHEVWARLLSSSLETRLRYTPSDCFNTFPFPNADPRALVPVLEDIGQRLYDDRAKYMVDQNVGLTVTYNRLKDPACSHAPILALRALHEEMDRAVLVAYAEGDPDGRWLEVDVPPFCPLTEDGRKKLAAFEDALIERLFALNSRRAAEEKRLGLGDAPKKKAAARRATAGADGKKPKAKPKGNAPPPDPQLAMPVPDPNEG